MSVVRSAGVGAATICSEVKVRTESVIEISVRGTLRGAAWSWRPWSEQSFELYTVTHTDCPHWTCPTLNTNTDLELSTTLTSDSTLKYIFNKAIFIILHIFVLATDISQHKSVLKYFHCIVFTVSKYFQKIKFDRRNKFYMGRYLLRLEAENCHAIAEK